MAHTINLISDVITIMFANAGVTDNTDLMRCNIFAIYLELCVRDGKELTIKSVKQSSEYKGLHYDVPFPDTFLQKLIDKAIELKNGL